MTKLQKISIVGGGALSIMLISASTTFASGFGSVSAGTGWVKSIGGLISSALSIVMVLALLLVLFYLIWGGISWITAGGDKGKTEEARNKITAAIIGIIILAASWALANFVAYLLGFSSLPSAIEGVQPINSTDAGATEESTDLLSV